MKHRLFLNGTDLTGTGRKRGYIVYTYEQKKFLNPQENVNIIYYHHDGPCTIHVHEFVELIFIAEGTATHYIDGERYDTEPGDLLFVNYGQTHAFEVGDNYQYYNLLYVPEFFSEELINSENIYEIFEISLFREFQDAGAIQTQMVRFRGTELLEIKKLAEDIYREFRQKEMGYRSILNGYSRVLFSKILRKLKAEEADPGMQNCINRLTTELLAYIDARCFEKISLKEIAQKTFYNPSYLSRMFKSQYGIGLSEYIKEKRMEEAARLLQSSDLSNEEIMSRVGYADRKQFYKAFKECYQQTPAEFRRSRGNS